MGGRDGEKGVPHQQQKKIDDSEGMCGSESDYGGCWGRICNPDRGHVLKDVLRGLLVLILLSIIVTVIFLLCYFLITDIENKEDEVIDNLVKEFSAGGSLAPEPEINIRTKEPKHPTDAEIYNIEPGRGDMPPGAKLREQTNNQQILKDEEHASFSPSSPAEGPKVEIVSPPIFQPEISSSTTSTPVATDDEVLVANPDDFLPVNYSEAPPRNDLPPPNLPDGAFIPVSNYDDADYNFEDAFANIGEFIVAESPNECTPLKLEICASMPWALSSYPNWVNNNNFDELTLSLNYFQSVVIGSRCSARALEYSCAILEPACGPDGIPLPPCKSFCEDVANSCGAFLISGNEHNIAFQCDRFPSSNDPNVCVDISSGPTTNASPVQNVEPISPSVTEVSEVIKATPTTEAPAVREEVNNVEVVQEATTELPVFICDHTKFLCDDGSDCLEQSSVCDGIQHCLDNTDELNCAKPEFATTSNPDTPLKFTASKIRVVEIEQPNSRRPSLSDMLSSTSLVAVPEAQPSDFSPVTTNRNRFATEVIQQKRNSKSIQNKSNNRKFFQFTQKPENKDNNQVAPSSKLSLASLLGTSSASSSARRPSTSSSPTQLSARSIRPSDSLVSNTRPLLETGQRRTTSLSDLLSTATLSASPDKFPARVKACTELRCLDGKCISLRQLNNGVVDCKDGSDEFSRRRR